MSVRRRCRVMSLHLMQLQFHPRGVGAPLLWCSVAALFVTLLIRVLAFSRGPSLIAPHRCSPATCTTQQGPLGSFRAALYFKANPGSTLGSVKSRGRAAKGRPVRGLAKERSDYLTPASRPAKDHFGLCSSITSARLRRRMRTLKYCSTAALAKTSPALTP